MAEGTGDPPIGGETPVEEKQPAEFSLLCSESIVNGPGKARKAERDDRFGRPCIRLSSADHLRCELGRRKAGDNCEGNDSDWRSLSYLHLLVHPLLAHLERRDGA